MGILASLFGQNKAKDAEQDVTLAELLARVAQLESQPASGVDEGARAQASAAAALAVDAQAAVDAITASVAALDGRVKAIEDDIAAAGEGAPGGGITLPPINP